ncbi:MAG: hypothetical protein CVU05_06515 [Bacteroidetes bacterium HGW-Bacteroidetes-21]|nr:MAG: hypothetical protein CVU05_06515 [Bacteroidetes bacterium HGW-Bacteroidetes-21]
MKNKTFLLLLFLSITLWSRADSIPSLKISLVPQYLAVNGFRMDFDIKADNKGLEWLVLSPRLYLVEKEQQENIGFQDYILTEMKGAGLDLSYRKFLGINKQENLDYFIGFTLGYTYYRPVYYRYVWTDILVNEMPMTTYMPGNDARDIYQPRAEFIMGFEYQAKNGLFFDIYGGGGIKQSFFDKQKGDPWRLYSYYWSYGYSGTYLALAFRMGFSF